MTMTRKERFVEFAVNCADYGVNFAKKRADCVVTDDGTMSMADYIRLKAEAAYDKIARETKP